MSTVGHVATTSAARIARQRRLRRGRTLVLAGVDLVALAIAYAATYVVAEVTAGPAVSAPDWFLALLLVIAVPVWIALFTAYRLYDNDSPRISVRELRRGRRRSSTPLLAGSLVLLLVLADPAPHRATGWSTAPSRPSLFLGRRDRARADLVRGAIRSWVFPRVMRRRRALIVGSGAEAAARRTGS